MRLSLIIHSMVFKHTVIFIFHLIINFFTICVYDCVWYVCLSLILVMFSSCSVSDLVASFLVFTADG
jgi:hypothetical protein